MQHIVFWTFDSADARSAHNAQSDFECALRRFCGDRVDATDAMLIYAELVGNAARHAPGLIRVQLECRDDHAELVVDDCGPVFSLETRKPGVLEEAGRGLFIVRALGAALAVQSYEGWTRVTARLPMRYAVKA